MIGDSIQQHVNQVSYTTFFDKNKVYKNIQAQNR